MLGCHALFTAWISNRVPRAAVQVTHTVLVTPEVQARIGGDGSATAAVTPFRAAVQQLLMFFADTYRKVFKFEHPPLHDPCAVAFVIAPELFQVRVRVQAGRPTGHQGNVLCALLCSAAGAACERAFNANSWHVLDPLALRLRGCPGVLMGGVVMVRAWHASCMRPAGHVSL